MKLSERQWNRLRENVIVLNGMTVDTTHKIYPRVIYNYIIYGKNIVMVKRKAISNGGKIIH